MFGAADGALSFCMHVCYDAYCFVCLNFLVHIEHWVDFASLEIDTNILAWCKPRIGCVIYCIPSSGEVHLILLWYCSISFWHLNDDQALWKT